MLSLRHIPFLLAETSYAVKPVPDEYHARVPLRPLDSAECFLSKKVDTVVVPITAGQRADTNEFDSKAIKLFRPPNTKGGREPAIETALSASSTRASRQDSGQQGRLLPASATLCPHPANASTPTTLAAPRLHEPQDAVPVLFLLLVHLVSAIMMVERYCRFKEELPPATS